MIPVPAADIARAHSETDIVSLVARRVELKRRGQSFWGCCPFHKEKSPSFKVDNVRRLFHCFGCGAGGDAIDWLMKAESMSFGDAVAALTGSKPLPQHSFVRPSYAPKPLEERAPFEEALSIWNSAKPAQGTVVEEYLRARAIRLPISPELRFAPRLRYGPTGQHFRAMVARLSDARGFCAIQRTFFVNDKPEKICIANPDPSGKPLPAKMTKGPMQGGAVRLRMPAGETLGIAEGLETALSVTQLYSLTVWATCGLSRLSLIDLPPVIRHLVIFADPGEIGRKAAYEAKRHYEIARGVDVDVVFPEDDYDAKDGEDFNDLVKRNAPRRVRRRAAS